MLEHERHPLSLHLSLQKTIDKLLHHKVLSKFQSNTGFCVHPEFDYPSPPADVHSNDAISLTRTDIRKLRQNSEQKFWFSDEGSREAEDNNKRTIDRINIIVDENKCGCNEGSVSSDTNCPAMAPFQFKQKYLHCNIPCIIRNIKLPITDQWWSENNNDKCNVRDETDKPKVSINTKWFLEYVGEDTIVPVRINQEGFTDGRAVECLTSKISLKEWINNARNNPKNYLKDWHMQSLFQGIYETPSIFNDVLNPFLLKNEGGDYRFVYWGCKGSTTTIHSDVLNSFSWSYNVVGMKRWTFYHPCDLIGSGEGCMVVMQGKGEMMFVPSGWRHSVENLEETISVNHNWIMAGALDCMFACLVNEIKAIETELLAWGTMSSNSSDAIEISRMKENMLRGCVGMDMSTFCVLVLDCLAMALIKICADGILQAPNIDKVDRWLDFIRITNVLGIVLDMPFVNANHPSKNSYEDREERVSIDLRPRLISTLGQTLGCKVVSLMHVLYDISVSCIQRDTNKGSCCEDIVSGVLHNIYSCKLESGAT